MTVEFDSFTVELLKESDKGSQATKPIIAFKGPDRYSSFADENKILKNSLRGPP